MKNYKLMWKYVKKESSHANVVLAAKTIGNQ